MLGELINKLNEEEAREAYRLICQRLVNLEDQESLEVQYAHDLPRRDS